MLMKKTNTEMKVMKKIENAICGKDVIESSGLTKKQVH